jgi:hypothetical protein
VSCVGIVCVSNWARSASRTPHHKGE